MNAKIHKALEDKAGVSTKNDSSVAGAQGVFQFSDLRESSKVQSRQKNAAIDSIQLKKVGGIQKAIQLGNIEGQSLIQLKRRSKHANWNQKQKDQNKRLFERRETRQAGYARERERLRIAIYSGMKHAQRVSFDSQAPAVKSAMRNLYNRGFAQQSSAPRAVFNRNGDFARCLRDARSVFGDLGGNRENGIDLNPAGVVKERYMINFHGVTVIIRNFSSNNAILGTIELQTGVVFEFKYA